MDIRRLKTPARQGHAYTSTLSAPDDAPHGIELGDSGAGISSSGGAGSSRTHRRCRTSPLEIGSTSPARKGPSLGGSMASRHYAGLRIAKENKRERQQIEDNLPKNIELRLRAQRERRFTRRKRGPLSRIPNPMRKIRSFLADPVTRFWLGCNICTVFMLFTLAVRSSEPHTRRPVRRARYAWNLSRDGRAHRARVAQALFMAFIYPWLLRPVCKY